jgi:ribosomal protein S18 acetylase RimI-like enzyme
MQDASVSIKLLRPSVDLASNSDDIWQMLTTVDKEFVPPLSSRTEDALKMDTQSSMWGGPIAFFDMVMREHVFFATVDDRPAGFLSFRVKHSNPALPEYSPCTYVSATVVLLRFRRMGVASMLNDALENLPESMSSPWIARRTWSTNESNLTLLAGRGFGEVVRLPNHRGAGIDTVYLVRRTKV